jgi:hypothetical protein
MEIFRGGDPSELVTEFLERIGKALDITCPIIE